MGRADRLWVPGNRLQLLENGEQFYPAVFGAIERARHEVLLETFILFEDKVGWGLHAVLLAAARRGVHVTVTVDDWGSPDLTAAFLDPLVEAGVAFRFFDPTHRLLRRFTALRRLHRKLVVVDGEVAYVGGINYSADHLGDFGPEAKQDYAVEVAGPVVAHIHRFACTVARRTHERTPWRERWQRRRQPVCEEKGALPEQGQAEVLFVTRDNGRHPTDIEREYRLAIRSARSRIVIANAYFFPGYRLIRDLKQAAKRGVDVRLILQGQPDMAIVKFAARTLYPHLLGAGVSIYEYCRRPLHGKVALVDDAWSTVGSSNLDPLSLSLNLEANVVIRDRGFNASLAQNLDGLMREHCKRMDPEHARRPSAWRSMLSMLSFHAMRLFPRLAGMLPRHRPRIVDASGEAVHPLVDEPAQAPRKAA